MNPELITRVVSLIQKNGDKVVLADPTTGKAVVVMDLDAYERLCVGQPAAPASVPGTLGTVNGLSVPSGAPMMPSFAAPAPVAQSMYGKPGPVGGQAPSEPVPVALAAPAAVPPAPPLVAKMPTIEVKKLTEFSEVPPKKKSVKVTPETMGVTHVMADLTQEELIDKINRDIGAWKTAQDRRRTDELKSAAQSVPQPETVSALEEEERFYLEPIE